MTRVTIDSATQAKLKSDEPLIVCSESGQVLGCFYPVVTGIQSPFSDEEIKKRAQQTGGAPLSEVLSRLGKS